MGIFSLLKGAFGKRRGGPLRSRSTDHAGPADPHAPPDAGTSGSWRFAVTLPADGSHAGRYALLQAVSPRGYPNDEDYILLVRRPGELCRPAYMVRVPFDEEPPMLLDYGEQPEVAVIYQGLTLAWTDDGCGTIRTPPKAPEGLFNLCRFGTHRIDRVEIQGEYLYVRMAAGRQPFTSPPAKQAAF